MYLELLGEETNNLAGLLASEGWVCGCVEDCRKHGIGSKEREIWGCERWVLGDSEQEGNVRGGYLRDPRNHPPAREEEEAAVRCKSPSARSLLLPTQTCPDRKKVNAALLKKVKGDVEGRKTIMRKL